MKIITLLEHENYQLRTLGLSAAEQQTLNQWAAHTQHKYMEVIGQSRLRVKGWVGVLQTGNFGVEILPKVGTASLFMQMLAYLGLCPPALSQPAQIRDYYTAQFLEEVAWILRKGLFKTYALSTQCRPQWRGNLHFGLQIAHNLARPTQFYTQAAELGTENLHNRLLFGCLRMIAGWNLPPELAQKAQKLSAQISEIPPQADLPADCEPLFARLGYNSQNIHYQNGLKIARTLLAHRQIGLEAGSLGTVWALLVQSAQLYEQYLRRQLSEAVLNRGLSWEFVQQTSRPFWESIQLRPDFVLRYTPTPQRAPICLVLDSKWKQPLQLLPAETDLRQLLTYQIWYDAPLGLLLYPIYAPDSPKSVSILRISEFKKEIFLKNTQKNLEAGGIFLNIAEENQSLNLKIGHDLLDFLESLGLKSLPLWAVSS